MLTCQQIRSFLESLPADQITFLAGLEKEGKLQDYLREMYLRVQIKLIAAREFSGIMRRILFDNHDAIRRMILQPKGK